MANWQTPNLEALLRQQESLRAVIEAIDREDDLSPSLTGLTQHARELLDAMVVEHAALRRDIVRLGEAVVRRTMHTATINRIGRLITNDLSLNQLLSTAIEMISEDFHFANLGLILIDPDNPERLVLRATTGVSTALIPKDYRQEIHQGIVGAAARTRQRILLNDVSRDPRFVPTPWINEVYAELAVPIVVGERLLGVLNVESTCPLSEEDAADLQIVADHLGVAIGNAQLFARTQQALEEMQLLYETSRRMRTAMDVDEVIKVYLEQVAVRGRYVCTVVVYEFDGAGQRTATIMRGRWTLQEGLVLLEERLPYTRDAFDPLLDAGQTVTIGNFRTDPRVSAELRRLHRRNPRPAWAMIPLMVRGQRLGLVILSDVLVRQWDNADLQPYQATAAQLAAAIDSRQQHLLLIDRGRQLAVLEERRRLAHELHDSVTQHIFSMTLIAQSIGPAWRRDSAEGERRVTRLLELSQSALSEMRALLAELRPPEGRTIAAGTVPAVLGIELVRRDGLAAALRRHLSDIARDGLQSHFEARGCIRQPREQQEALYRIAQEALNNVIKHAQARRVELTLSTVHGATRLTVEDDGRGFIVAPVGAPSDRVSGGFGLRTMQERAEALGGQVRIISTPGRGTTVDVTIPQKDAQP
jgi:signal transduction histidine kinase/putative methionine-R-sulfoxide reductase with GAF domain